MAVTFLSRSGRRWRPAASLTLWLLLPLLGCGSTLQAEDGETVAIVQRARELYDQGDFGTAREKATLAVNRSPDNPQARYVRGLANLKLHDYALAREDLERAQQLDPLTTFAASKEEFAGALQTAVDNTAEALGGGITTPPLASPPAEEPGAGEAAEAAPAAGSEPAGEADPAPRDAEAGPKAKPEPTDPLAKELAAGGPVIADHSGEDVLGAPQKQAMQKAMQTPALRSLTPKFLVLPAGAEPADEARRLATEAGLTGRDLLIVGQLPDRVAVYHLTLTPDAIAEVLGPAMAGAGEASLARRMILAAEAVGPLVTVPPEPPAEVTPPVPAPAPPVPAGTVPAPAPGPPYQTIAASLAGLVVALLVWTVLARLLRRRRLSRGFALASPHLRQVAEHLGTVCAGLLAKPDRQAAAALAAAELAYFDAVAMMSAADDEDTGHVARVERAERLLAEADARLGEATERLPDAPAGTPTGYCWFTGRPLASRWDGDLVELRHGGAVRQVLAARAVGAVLRKGETPQVRAVERNGQPVHWAEVAEFDPLIDFYRTDRYGWLLVAPSALSLDLSAEPDRPIYVELDERPDFTLEL